MGRRLPIKTTIREAVDYWSRRIDECGLSIDWSEAETHCWRCGCEKNLQRCHIIPDPLGGKDEPGNIVLLCSRCHAEGPNVTDPEIMWDWIRAYGVPFYETFWNIRGMQEYKFIYHKSLSDEISDILCQANISPDDERAGRLIKENLQSVHDKGSIHFGQPYLNTATMAGLYRMMLKHLAETLGVCFPVAAADEGKPRTPWWSIT